MGISQIKKKKKKKKKRQKNLVGQKTNVPSTQTSVFLSHLSQREINHLHMDFMKIKKKKKKKKEKRKTSN